VKSFWTFVYIFLFGSLIVLFIKNPKSFSTVTGTLFTSLDSMGLTLTGGKTAAGN
jgi:hypothetical protein